MSYLTSLFRMDPLQISFVITKEGITNYLSEGLVKQVLSRDTRLGRTARVGSHRKSHIY